jgi:hypothetical protein
VPASPASPPRLSSPGVKSRSRWLTSARRRWAAHPGLRRDVGAVVRARKCRAGCVRSRPIGDGHDVRRSRREVHLRKRGADVQQGEYQRERGFPR